MKENKKRLHIRNRNRDQYDFDRLLISKPTLETYITSNKKGLKTIDFSDPKAVKVLNTAILKCYYDVEYWDFPIENLCPPIPGRAEYIHLIADLLADHNKGKVPFGKKVLILDVGTGATCIYPIIGVKEYDWNFIASDVNRNSLKSAEKIMANNDFLKGKISFRYQNNVNKIFEGILKHKEMPYVTICNPPFHASQEDADKVSLRKQRGLSEGKLIKANVIFLELNMNWCTREGNWVL